MSYIVRVVLHERKNEAAIPEKDYESLHKAMESNGFYKIVQDKITRKWFYLPPAKYIKHTTDTILLLAKNTVNTVRKENSILCTEYKDIKWLDLKPLDI
jgi:hypothetical protein